jgi:hypothetical protein
MIIDLILINTNNKKEFKDNRDFKPKPKKVIEAEEDAYYMNPNLN